jgi:hypothetical protein
MAELSTGDCSWCFHFQTGVSTNVIFQFNFDWVGMPNIFGVLSNRTVRGKLAHSGCIENGHPYPAFPLLISLADLILAIYVGLIIGE